MPVGEVLTTISCPWCGTNYLEFQPNCKNCGGPLPAPAKAAGFYDPTPDALLAPPPAPRPISGSYAWKLLLADGGAIAGFILALIGGILLMVGGGLTLGVITAFVGIPLGFVGFLLLAAGAGLLVWRFQEKQKVVDVLRTGQAARGEVTAVQENPAVRINERHPWQIEYQFQVDGQSYSGSVTTLNLPGRQLEPGRPVVVLYLPGRPQLNALYPHP